MDHHEAMKRKKDKDSEENYPRNFRLDPVSLELLDKLQRRLGLGPGDIVRLAVRALAQREGIEIPMLER